MPGHRTARPNHDEAALLFRGSHAKLTFPEDARLHPASTAATAAPAPTPVPLAGVAASTSPTGYHASATQGTDYLNLSSDPAKIFPP